jgi:DNA repair photolyase
MFGAMENTTVIYEPRGRAKEYSPLACNLYRGCSHRCRYCYAPACQRTNITDWADNVWPRRDVIRHLEKDAAKLRGDPRDVLLCFLCDPYQPADDTHRLTRQALEILGRNALTAQVLTKGGTRTLRDFDLMRRYGVRFGSTMVFCNDADRAEWEPAAAPVEDRIKAIKAAHAEGIFTWVSLEPVIDPQQSLALIRELHAHVDFWKVGKLNHMRDHEATTDWRAFREDALALLRKLNAKAYIKNDLRLA